LEIAVYLKQERVKVEYLIISVHPNMNMEYGTFKTISQLPALWALFYN